MISAAFGLLIFGILCGQWPAHMHLGFRGKKKKPVKKSDNPRPKIIYADCSVVAGGQSNDLCRSLDS